LNCPKDATSCQLSRVEKENILFSKKIPWKKFEKLFIEFSYKNHIKKTKSIGRPIIKWEFGYGKLSIAGDFSVKNNEKWIDSLNILESEISIYAE